MVLKDAFGNATGAVCAKAKLQQLFLEGAPDRASAWCLPTACGLVCTLPLSAQRELAQLFIST